ncbi:MAG: hypothetical protein WBC37_12925 [Burkholderiaceae bacterium]
MRTEPLARRASQRALRTLFALCALVVAGCASEPLVFEAAPAQPTARIDRSIAFLHSAEFRDRQETLEPYGNKYYVPLKIGEASDRALRATYPRLFADAREASPTDTPASTGGAPRDVPLLEPSIVGLRYLNASHRMEGPFYSQVEYRFRLSDAGGAAVAEWTVRGFGRFPSDVDRQPRTKDSPPAPRGEQGYLIEAPRRAVEDGVDAFTHSFNRVPELIRWTRGEGTADANAPLSLLSTKGALSSSEAVEAGYPGVFTMTVERAALPRPSTPPSEERAPDPPLIALRITLRNEAERRLALDPADIEWIPEGAAALEPIPPAVAAALVTRLPFGLAVAPGVGAAALPALFAALISAAEVTRHQSEYAAWSAAATSQTLADGVTGPRATTSGLVFFPRPDAAGGVVVVRVVDLDAAVRYTVRIPVASR